MFWTPFPRVTLAYRLLSFFYHFRGFSTVCTSHDDGKLASKRKLKSEKSGLLIFESAKFRCRVNNCFGNEMNWINKAHDTPAASLSSPKNWILFAPLLMTFWSRFKVQRSHVKSLAGEKFCGGKKCFCLFSRSALRSHSRVSSRSQQQQN